MNSNNSTGIVHFPTHEYRPFTGGIAVYIEEMAIACAQNGVTPVVWAPDYGKAISQEQPFRVVRVPMRGKQDWLCRLRMGSSLLKEIGRRPFSGTVVLAEPGPIRWWMYSLLTRPPQPARLVIVLHGSELKQLTSSPLHRLYFGRLLRKADCVGVVSNAIRKMAVSAYPSVEPRLRVVPGAIRSFMQHRQAPQWSTRKKQILHVGRLHPRKGQLQLVEACGQLPERHRNSYRLRLVGPHSRPAYVNQVRKAANDLSIRVDIPGELSESQLVEAYSEARLFAMTSQEYKSSIEGLGLALLEAQHLGCPVVATDVGGVAEAIDPEASGILVPPGDPARLAAAIQQFLDDADRSAKAAARGREFVGNSFSWQRNVQALGLI